MKACVPVPSGSIGGMLCSLLTQQVRVDPLQSICRQNFKSPAPMSGPGLDDTSRAPAVVGGGGAAATMPASAVQLELQLRELRSRTQAQEQCLVQYKTETDKLLALAEGEGVSGEAMHGMMKVWLRDARQQSEDLRRLFDESKAIAAETLAATKREMGGKISTLQERVAHLEASAAADAKGRATAEAAAEKLRHEVSTAKRESELVRSELAASQGELSGKMTARQTVTKGEICKLSAEVFTLQQALVDQAQKAAEAEKKSALAYQLDLMNVNSLLERSGEMRERDRAAFATALEAAQADAIDKQAALAETQETLQKTLVQLAETRRQITEQFQRAQHLEQVARETEGKHADRLVVAAFMRTRVNLLRRAFLEWLLLARPALGLPLRSGRKSCRRACAKMMWRWNNFVAAQHRTEKKCRIIEQRLAATHLRSHYETWCMATASGLWKRTHVQRLISRSRRSAATAVFHDWQGMLEVFADRASAFNSRKQFSRTHRMLKAAFQGWFSPSLTGSASMLRITLAQRRRRSAGIYFSAWQLYAQVKTKAHLNISRADQHLAQVRKALATRILRANLYMRQGLVLRRRRVEAKRTRALLSSSLRTWSEIRLDRRTFFQRNVRLTLKTLRRRLSCSLRSWRQNVTGSLVDKAVAQKAARWYKHRRFVRVLACLAEQGAEKRAMHKRYLAILLKHQRNAAYWSLRVWAHASAAHRHDIKRDFAVKARAEAHIYLQAKKFSHLWLEYVRHKHDLSRFERQITVKRKRNEVVCMLDCWQQSAHMSALHARNTEEALRLAGEAADLKKALDEALAKAADAQQHLTGLLEQRIPSLEADKARMSERLDLVHMELEAKESEALATKTQVSMLHDTIDEMRGFLNDPELKSVPSEDTQLLAKTKLELEHVRAEYGSLQADVQHKDAEIAHLTEQIALTQQQVTRAQQAMSAIEAQTSGDIQSMVQEKVLAEKMFAEFQHKLRAQFRAELEAKDAESTALKAHVSVLQTAINEMLQDHDAKSSAAVAQFPMAQHTAKANAVRAEDSKVQEQNQSSSKQPYAHGAPLQEEAKAVGLPIVVAACHSTLDSGPSDDDGNLDRGAKAVADPWPDCQEDAKNCLPTAKSEPRAPPPSFPLSPKAGTQDEPRDRQEVSLPRSSEKEKDRMGHYGQVSDAKKVERDVSWQVQTFDPVLACADLSSATTKREEHSASQVSPDVSTLAPHDSIDLSVVPVSSPSLETSTITICSNASQVGQGQDQAVSVSAKGNHVGMSVEWASTADDDTLRANSLFGHQQLDMPVHTHTKYAGMLRRTFTASAPAPPPPPPPPKGNGAGEGDSDKENTGHENTLDITQSDSGHAMANGSTAMSSVTMYMKTGMESDSAAADMTIEERERVVVDASRRRSVSADSHIGDEPTITSFSCRAALKPANSLLRVRRRSQSPGGRSIVEVVRSKPVKPSAASLSSSTGTLSTAAATATPVTDVPRREEGNREDRGREAREDKGVLRRQGLSRAATRRKRDFSLDSDSD